VIDEVRIYRRALSETEIQGLMGNDGTGDMTAPAPPMNLDLKLGQ